MMAEKPGLMQELLQPPKDKGGGKGGGAGGAERAADKSGPCKRGKDGRLRRKKAGSDR